MQAKDKSIYSKLQSVKSGMSTLKKTSKNPFFKSKYADLNSHLEMLEPLLSDQNLVLLQPVKADSTGSYVETVIIDSDSATQISSIMRLPELSDMQKLGAAITYARRFTLGSLFAVQAHDDDGETAVGRGNKGRKTSSRTDDF